MSTGLGPEWFHTFNTATDFDDKIGHGVALDADGQIGLAGNTDIAIGVVVNVPTTGVAGWAKVRLFVPKMTVKLGAACDEAAELTFVAGEAIATTTATHRVSAIALSAGVDTEVIEVLPYNRLIAVIA